MLLIGMIKYLFRARCLSAIACLGIALAFKGFSTVQRQAGAVVAISAGTAVVAVMVQRDRVWDAEYVHHENHLLEIEQLQHEYAQREAALKTFLDSVMAESDALKGRVAQMHEVLADDQSEKVLIFGELEALEKEHAHVLYELQVLAIAQQKGPFRSAPYPQAGAGQHHVQATARVAELEAALAKRTDMATQMLTELEAEATHTFNQFNAKLASQSKVMEALYQQVESLKQENASLFRQQLGHQVSGHQVSANQVRRSRSTV